MHHQRRSPTGAPGLLSGQIRLVQCLPANRIACPPVRLFVYVVVHDTGFAPNPFSGYCTLATCKPGIRRSARVGDWIAGIGSVQRCQEGKLVFAMRVAETMCLDEYRYDTRFVRKRPNRSGGAKQRCGDNIYHRDPGTGHWIQEAGYHSHEDGTPKQDYIRRDTSPPRVLRSAESRSLGSVGTVRRIGAAGSRQVAMGWNSGAASGS